MEKQNKSIADILTEVFEEVCNDYCKYSGCDDEESLNEICADCPLNKLI